MFDIVKVAKDAKKASYSYGLLDTNTKNAALLAVAKSLRENEDKIFSVNAVDVENAKKAGYSEALVDRLTITKARFEEMVFGVEKVVKLSDPVGRIYDGRTVESGLQIVKKSVPFGVIGVIFESRPNVTVDIAALCIKSGNACILRGGKECLATNVLLHSIIIKALESARLDPNGVSLISDTDREIVSKMLKLSDYIDLIIPRGGVALQRMCQESSSIPVIIGGFGISHIFVDSSADLLKSADIVFNAKTQKPSACNSLDTLLVHKDVAEQFIPLVSQKLKEKKVTLVTHNGADRYLSEYPYKQEGDDESFFEEFLSLKMNITIVNDIYEVIEHMRAHNAQHSDAILTDSASNAKLFASAAPSACVYVNASTRFSDGGQFGLGAEVAISTQKMHARGPMALEELTTYQYVCQGDYLTRK